ncbi:hypothetical protein G7A66_12085 [Altererythrobacter sp. SALINAS58]|nr:hypothetical protein [Alteripontixanthobacter muriae]
MDVVLHEKGIAFERVYDLPWAEATHTRRHSPLEQLPILLPEKGEPVWDSALIVDWLEIMHPDPPLMPQVRDARIHCMRRRTLGERIMEIAQALIFEVHRDPPAEITVDRLTRKIEGGLSALEKLYDHRTGGKLECDQGDIALATTLLCWEFIIAEGISPPLPILTWRGKHRAIDKCVFKMEARPSFMKTAPQAMQVDIAGEVAV